MTYTKHPDGTRATRPHAEGEWPCSSQAAGYWCTLPYGHEPPHEAGMDTRRYPEIAASWDDDGAERVTS
jgi:hypothetical protein